MFDILTSRTLSDCTDDYATDQLYGDQNAILFDRLGIGWDSFPLVWRINSNDIYCGTIQDMFECYVTKDGSDLVEFNNGHIGFVLYENGRIAVTAEMIAQSFGSIIML